MDLKDLEKVQDLRSELRDADLKLMLFEKHPEATISAFAELPGLVTVELMPVEKSIAVSAARRQRERIVNELRQLGVTVED